MLNPRQHSLYYKLIIFTFVLLASLLLDLPPVLDQAECGVVVTAADMEIARNEAPGIRQTAENAPNNQTAVVPVRIIAVRDDNGNGPNPSLADAEAALAILEAEFSTLDHPYDFVLCGNISYLDNSSFFDETIPVADYSYIAGVVNIFLSPNFSNNFAFFP